MGYFPHAYCKTLIANNALPILTGDGDATVPAPNGTTKGPAILAGQLGIINANGNVVQDVSLVPTYANCQMFYIAQGSHYASDKLGPHHGGYQETVKTKGINPKYVSEFYKVESQEPLNAVLTVDSGVDCDTIACDTTYYLRVDVKGSPALRLLTHNGYITAPAFSGCCDDSNSNIDPAVIHSGWAEYINDDARLVGFIRATAYYDVNATVAATATAAAAADITASATVDVEIGDRVVFDLDAAPVSGGASSLEGYTLTVDSVSANTIFSVGMTLTGTNVVAGTKIIRLISGDGGATSEFEVDIYNGTATAVVTGEVTVTAYVDTAAATNISLIAAANAYAASTTAITSVFTSTATALVIWRAIDADTYVPLVGAAADTNRAMIELVGAYVDTKFGLFF